MIVTSFLVRAKETSDWWQKQTPEFQSQYIAEHPNSQFAKDAKEKAEAPKTEKPAAEDETKPSTAPAAKPSSGGKESLTPAAADRATWPAHIQKLKLPPAWTDVRYSDDENASLQAVGKDKKGRPQYVYSEAFAKTQSALKFTRVLELDSKFQEVYQQNAEGLKSKDPKVRDHAGCLQLIMSMGLRPGSDNDTGAEKQAYGATTLQGQHVVVEDGKTFLRFTGKKGVDLNLEVTDPELAASLQARAKKSKKSGKMFPTVTDASLSEHSQSMDGGGFKTKDFRTRLGTATANELISGYDPQPTDVDSYKKAVKEVAVAVSKKLGNTPTIALQSYIAPEVFSAWKPIEGLE